MSKKTPHKQDDAAGDGSPNKTVATKAADTTDVESSDTKQSFIGRLKSLDRKKKVSAIVGGVLVLLAIATLTIRPLRLMALNLFSDADVTIMVVDARSEQPVTGVTVTLHALSGETDTDGRAAFTGIDFGESDVTVSRDAYESVTETIEVTQSEQTFALTMNPTGMPYTVRAVNWVTDEPISTFTVSDETGELTTSATEGVATLNIPTGTESAELSISADGYNQKNFTTNLLADEDGAIPESAAVKLTKAGRHHFLSNRDGRISLWSSNLDGSDAQVVVEDTGRKSGRLSMSLSPDGKYAVMTAPIKQQRNDDNTLLEELYIVNLESGELVLADEGDAWFRILEVENNRVVYTANLYDNSITNRGKIKTYTFDSDTLHTAFESHEVSSPLYAQNKVFFNEVKRKRFACSYCRDGYRYETSSETYFVLDLVTDEFKTIKNSERATTYLNPENRATILYSYYDDGEKWFEYDLDSGESTKLDVPPTSINEIAYPFDDPSPDGQRTAWRETRDGDGVLILGNAEGMQEAVVDSGELEVNYVARWIDNEYLVVNGSENGGKSGDYIIHVASGSYSLITQIYRDTYYYRYGYYGI